MAELDVSVAGRNYRLACDDGQEPHLRALAAMLDGEARALSAAGGIIGEARLLLMTALMMADRLHETEAQLRATQGAAAPEADAPALGESLDRLDALIAAHERSGAS
ncbi:MAG: cell division protein ZapA [Rubrimonas sp.]|uniref:cell division protein ZapA n=1 Tax=Rubrimonas sp. TaxID=2036015 RepID=UPI002FDE5AE7